MADHADELHHRGRTHAAARLGVFAWAALLLVIPAARAGADPGLRERLDHVIERHERYDLSGAVGVIVGDDFSYSRGVGQADRLSGTANTPQTLFDLGIVSMQFTAAAALRLEMAGRLTMDTTLGELIAEAPADKRGITIGQLIRHESGMVELVNLAGAEGSRPERALSRLLAEPLAREPGSGYGFSTAGYAVLATAIERAAGEPFRDYIRREVFAAGGMKNAHFTGDVSLDASLVAMRYADFGDRETIGTALSGRWNWALNGVVGVVASVEDMMAWVNATRHGAFFSDAARAFFYKPDHNGHSPAGLWYEGEAAGASGERRVQMSGASTGFESAVAVFPAQDAAIVILLNCNGMLAKVGSDLEQAMLQPPDAEPPAEVIDETHARLVGSYQMEDGSRLSVASVKGQLVVTGRGQRALERLVHGDNFDPTWRGFYDEMSTQAVRCVEAIARGDAETVRSFMARGSMASDAERLLSAAPPIAPGSKARPLGTVSLPGALTSFVAWGDGDEAPVIALRWHGRELIGLDLRRPEDAIRVPISLQRRGVMEGPSADGVGEVRMSFERDGVEPVDTIKVQATRVAPSETARRVE